MIRFIRLIRGEDIIADVVKDKKTSIVIRDIMTMSSEIDIEDGTQSMILFPWLPWKVLQDNTVELKKRDIMLISPVCKDITEYYEYNCQEAEERLGGRWHPKNRENLKNSSDSSNNILSFSRSGKVSSSNL